MIDPFASISLAAAIVQFIDFGARVVRGSREIYLSRDGAQEEHIALKHVANEVSHLNELVMQAAAPRSAALQHDATLYELGKSCQSIAAELIATLDLFAIQETNGVKHRWLAFRKSMASQMPRNKERIQALDRRLERVQDQISRRLLLIIR